MLSLQHLSTGDVGVNILSLTEEQLAALDEMMDLLDEAATFIRAEKLGQADQKIRKARKKAQLIRGVRNVSTASGRPLRKRVPIR